MKNYFYYSILTRYRVSTTLIVGYDGGADHVVSYAGITPGNVGALIDGAIFTRGTSEKKHTAIFIGGANMAAGEELLTAATKHQLIVILPDGGRRTKWTSTNIRRRNSWPILA